MADLPRYVLIVPADGDPHGLLAPGAPVYSPRDLLEGWTVEGPIRTMVHAPTEGDGNVHSLNGGVWALRVIWDGAVVPEGVGRAKWVLARCVNLRGRHGLLWDIAGPVGNQYWILSSNGVARHFGRVEDEPPELALAREVVALCGGRMEVSGD